MDVRSLLRYDIPHNYLRKLYIHIKLLPLCLEFDTERVAIKI